jgi:hypothetical protein
MHILAVALPLALTAPSLRAHAPVQGRRAVVTLAAPKTFEKALDDAPSMCAALQAGEAPSDLAAFVGSSAGARGFFVHYLTGDEYTCADSDDVPPPLVESLEGASAETIEIMLMNVAMSSATALAHVRAGHDEMAASSERTQARATILVAAMWERLPALQTAFAALSEAVASEFLVEAPPQPEAVDEWVAFLARWQYDDEQTQRISDALDVIKQRVQPQAA